MIIIFGLLLVFFSLLIINSFYKNFLKKEFISKNKIMIIHYITLIIILSIEGMFRRNEINKENICTLILSLFIIIFIHIKHKFFDTIGFLLLSGFLFQIIYWIYKLKDFK